MAEFSEATVRPLLEAVAFAARAHGGQLRKDGKTPYFSHVVRVCLIVRHVFGIDDADVLKAALLHDTLEDTTTDSDDLEEAFGGSVTQWVAALSKDKRLLEAVREKAYAEQLARGPWQVTVCKLADIYDNLMDSVHTKPAQQQKTFRNAHRYLDALKKSLTEQSRRPWEIVAQLLTTMEGPSAS
jgi:guanosine-3',5'-bis(diphosphate) 3'-pyrophosphohydrolase